MSGNVVPRITEAEHIGPEDTGDNISAKRTANYYWNDQTGNWERAVQGSSSGGSSTGGATEAQQVAQGETLEEIEHAVQSIASARGIASDLRVTLLGGTTAVTGSLTSAGTVSTVTTVTTVAGLTNIGGLPAQSLITSTNNTNAVLSNINNVSV